jgi:hypothetical protein
MLYHSGSGQVAGWVEAANLKVKSAVGDAVSFAMPQ